MRFPLAVIPFGEVFGELVDNDLFIHFEYLKKDFKLSDYKAMMVIWSDILLGLKDTGVKVIFTCIPKDEEQINKFQVMFGLSPYKEDELSTLYRMEL